MDGFSEIFQAMIQDHGRRPRNFGELEEATHTSEGVNPITGDQLKVSIQISSEGDEAKIKQIRFSGTASALATTSASVMTSHLQSLPLQEARECIARTLRWFAGEESVPTDLPEDEYAVLLEIRNIPHRVPCARLAWNTADSALANPEP